MYRVILAVTLIYVSLSQSACTDSLHNTNAASLKKQQTTQYKGMTGKESQEQATQYRGMTGKESEEECHRLMMMILGVPGDCSNHRIPVPQGQPARDRDNYDVGEVYRRTHEQAERAVCKGETGCY